MYRYLLAVILLTLTACAGSPAEAPVASTQARDTARGEGAAAPAPPAPEPAPAPRKAKKANGAPQKLISVRDFLVQGEKTPAGYAAYGYLIFSGRPSTAEEKKRYASICDAYLNKIEPEAAYADTAHQMFATTYWPLTQRIKQYSASCKTIIQNYDYATAEKIVSVSGIPQHHRGPFIVAWTIPYEDADTNTTPKLILDLSTLPNEDMNYAIKVWKENVATNPEAWTQGRMNRTVILAAFQDFMRKYSDAIIKIISS